LIIKLWRGITGKDVQVRDVDKTEVYVSQELFLCNTAKQIRPVASVDHISIGDSTHERTKRIAKGYYDTVIGMNNLCENDSVWH